MCSTKTTFPTDLSTLNLEWNNPEEFPDRIGQNGFSIDVIVYFPDLAEHSIAWFDYKNQKWYFLRNQDYNGYSFQWRYFCSKNDIPELVKKIDGFDYSITSWGRVYSHVTDKYLKPTKAGKGYLQVKLHKEGSNFNFYVARLVAIYFIDNPNQFSEVNHKDEDKNNNCSWNLEWCTRKYNVNYGSRTQKARLGSQKPIIRVSDDGSEKIYHSVKSVEDEGFSRTQVSKCLKGKHIYHKGYKWKYQ